MTQGDAGSIWWYGRAMVATESPPDSASPACAEALVAAAGRCGIGVAVSGKRPGDKVSTWLFASRVAIDLVSTTPRGFSGLPVEPSFGGDTYVSPESLVILQEYPNVRCKRGELVHRDSKRVPVRWISVELESQEALLCVHWFFRVDRQSHAERALVSPTLRFRRLIDAAPDGVLVLVDRQIVYANLALS